jgi:hypothetical protein
MKTDPYLPGEEEGPAVLLKICAIQCMASSHIGRKIWGLQATLVEGPLTLTRASDEMSDPMSSASQQFWTQVAAAGGAST